MINYLINLLISQMSAPLPNSSRNLEYKQDDKTYRIEYYINLDKFYLSIRNISKIESFYELEISLDDIKRGKSFKAETFMGLMRNFFFKELCNKYPYVKCTYGYITKHLREKYHFQQ